MARLKENTVVDILMNDSDDDTLDSASVISNATSVDEVDGDIGVGFFRNGGRKRSSEEMDSDSDSEIVSSKKKATLKKKKVVKEKENSDSDSLDRPSRGLARSQTVRTKTAPKVTIRRYSGEGYKASITPEKKPDKRLSSLKSQQNAKNSPLPLPDLPLLPPNIRAKLSRGSTASIELKNSPSISRLTGSPYRRKTISLASDLNLTKTPPAPEAKRRSSGKTPESLDGGRRRLSISLFDDANSADSGDKMKNSNRGRRRSEVPSRSSVSSEGDVFDLPRRFSSIYIQKENESSPRKVSSRVPKAPVRYIEDSESDLSPSPKKEAFKVKRYLGDCKSGSKLKKEPSTPKAQKSTPQKNLFGAKSPSVVLKDVSAPSPGRRTPRRSASLKVKTYADMSQHDDDESPIGKTSLPKVTKYRLVTYNSL